jgi:hypothetical protein
MNELLRQRRSQEIFNVSQRTGQSMYGAPAHPIHRLSVELLSEIFLHCPANDYLPSPFIFSSTSPLLLAQVCHLWRETALSTPALWTSLRLNLRHDVIGTDAFALAAHSWLLRSGALPISLTILSSCEPTKWFPDRIIRAIMPFAPRWRTLQLVMPSFALASFSTILGQLPLLERLELEIYSPTPIRFTTIEAPRLSSLRLSYVLFVNDSIVLWKQLTCLEFERQNLGTCLKIIDLIPSLLSLHFKAVFHYPLQLLSQDVVVSNIRFLSLKEVSSGTMAMLFSKLTLPELSELSLSDNQDPWPCAEFTGVACRSQFKIRKLTLKYVKRIYYDQFPAIAEGMKDVEELDLSFFTAFGQRHPPRAEVDVIHCLTSPLLPPLTEVRPDGATVMPQTLYPTFPKLQVLTLDGVSRVHDQALVNMIESRWKVEPCVDEVSRLRLVNFRERRCWDAVQVQRLEEFFEQGLKVWVGGSGVFAARRCNRHRRNVFVENSEGSSVETCMA